MSEFMKISKQVFRRYIAGKQGLWPGRRWRGVEGIRAALDGGAVVQIDPLCVLARSHDLALHARVADYRPEDLHTVLYSERQGFDWGGTVYVHPMRFIPFYRAVMARKAGHEYWLNFAERYRGAIDEVSASVRANGPQSNRAFSGDKLADRYWRTGKDTGRALYYLWMTGTMMTAYRKGFERYYDFAENIIPSEWQSTANLEDAEDFFANQVFVDYSAVTALEFKNLWSGKIERKVDLHEAQAKLDILMKSSILTVVDVDGLKNRYYLPSKDIDLLNELGDGGIPAIWQAIYSDNETETLFLAPLEIISARGRARQVFDFDYLWEVYKPANLRRWGYYTIPVLYQDRLVARFDSRIDRSLKQLQLLGYWQEDDFQVTDAYRPAFRTGIERLMKMVDAQSVTGMPEMK
jgi:uncharacterized protein